MLNNKNSTAGLKTKNTALNEQKLAEGNSNF